MMPEALHPISTVEGRASNPLPSNLGISSLLHQAFLRATQSMKFINSQIKTTNKHSKIIILWEFHTVRLYVVELPF